MRTRRVRPDIHIAAEHRWRQVSHGLRGAQSVKISAFFENRRIHLTPSRTWRDVHPLYVSSNRRHRVIVHHRHWDMFILRYRMDFVSVR